MISLSDAASILKRQSLLSTSRKKDEPLGFLCFKLDEREYGVDLNLINQIVKSPPLTWVPQTEQFVLGVVSIRGAVVTLVDLRQLMDLPPTKHLQTSRVLIVEVEHEQIGLLVDSVTQVRRIRMSDLEKKPGLGEGPRAEQVLYVARPDADNLVVIVDLNAILGEKLR